MASIKDIRVSNYDVHVVPVAKITRREGWNARRPGPDLDAHIDMLVQSILTHGYDKTQPMSGFADGDSVVIVKGHCRSTAVEVINQMVAEGTLPAEKAIANVPVILEPKGTSERHMKLDIYKSNSGKNLTQLDQADLFSDLRDNFSMEPQEIANELAISIVQVKNMLLLSEASEELQALIQEGKLSATLAYETMKEHGVTPAEDILFRSWNMAEAQGKKKTSQRFVDAVVAGDKPAPVAAPVETVVPVAADDDVPFDIDGDETGDEEPVDDLIEIGDEDIETIDGDDDVTEEEVFPEDDDVTPAKKPSANGADGAPKLDLRTARELLINFRRDLQKLADLAEAGDKDALADAVNDYIDAVPDVLDNLSAYGIDA